MTTVCVCARSPMAPFTVSLIDYLSFSASHCITRHWRSCEGTLTHTHTHRHSCTHANLLSGSGRIQDLSPLCPNGASSSFFGSVVLSSLSLSFPLFPAACTQASQFAQSFLSGPVLERILSRQAVSLFHSISLLLLLHFSYPSLGESLRGTINYWIGLIVS